MDIDRKEYFMQEAIRLSRESMDAGKGGPFGCVIVKDDEIIARGSNLVTSTNDPTAHAEIVAIREACKSLKSFQLTGCDIYTTCEPCPMCLGAIYWARPEKVYYASTRQDAAHAGFDDDFIYKELTQSIDDRSITFERLSIPEAKEVFEKWKMKSDRIEY